jgi:two-component system, LytTR family, response regulator
MKIQSVIVEDELTAQEVLRSYLHKYCPQVEVLAWARDAREAIETLHQTKPQLVFLDVELPYGNAFDILDACKELKFETIFVTAYSEYSLKALNQSAAYYLLKPLNIEELITAVNKVHEQLSRQEQFDRNRYVLENFREQQIEKRTIIVPTISGFDVVQMTDIVRLQGNGNFTDIYLLDGTKKMACRFLKHYSEILPFPFVRVHKSHVVNANYVVSYHKTHGGYVVLNDGTEVFVSQHYKDDFLKCFQ